MTHLATLTPLANSNDQLAALLKAAGDPLRLNVLTLLGQSSFGVLELCEMLGMRQPGLSHHLKVLAQAGLVETRREGTFIYYRRRLPPVDDPVTAVQQALFKTLDDSILPEALQQKLEHVQQRRAEQSRTFFSRHAHTLAEQQDLIAQHDRYTELAAQLLTRACADSHRQRALEIGPGEGLFLHTLSTRFDHVIALDNSEAMQQQARRHIARRKLDNVTCQLGEWPAAASQLPAQDAIVLNMVLHHLPAPAACINACGKQLQPGGVLLLTELCPHDQGWARESCGDLWLGFDENELNLWATQAGLAPEETQFLAMNNGFQVQVRTYRKQPPAH